MILGHVVFIVFQSSPAPKGRCYPWSASSLRRRGTCFNPHRPRRAGATRAPHRVCVAGRAWFQSSPAPKGRCYPPTATLSVIAPLFQSSPAPKGRCYGLAHERCGERRVSILTGPEGPVLRAEKHNSSTTMGFQSSPAPKGRCYISASVAPLWLWSFNPHRPRRAGATFVRRAEEPRGVVSILTGPEGPVLRLHARRNAGYRKGFQSSPAPKGRCYQGLLHRPGRQVPVSILTGPEGPVLRAGARVEATNLLFQSSPAPKGRCYRRAWRVVGLFLGFNPHRPRRAGATHTPDRAARRCLCFNPHRPRRAGATYRLIRFLPSHCSFNPHRPRRAGATTATAYLSRPLVGVSILTGPEGPVLRAKRDRSDGMFLVSILTGPEGPVLPSHQQTKRKRT